MMHVERERLSLLRQERSIMKDEDGTTQHASMYSKESLKSSLRVPLAANHSMTKSVEGESLRKIFERPHVHNVAGSYDLS